MEPPQWRHVVESEGQQAFDLIDKPRALTRQHDHDPRLDGLAIALTSASVLTFVASVDWPLGDAALPLRLPRDNGVRPYTLARRCRKHEEVVPERCG